MTDQTGRRDHTAVVLNEVAEAADATAREQRQAATTSRRLSRARERGASWHDIATSDRPRTLLGLLGASALRLVGAAGDFRRALARALIGEGLTTREIGQRLGVSHQRVSSLLRKER